MEGFEILFKRQKTKGEIENPENKNKIFKFRVSDANKDPDMGIIKASSMLDMCKAGSLGKLQLCIRCKLTGCSSLCPCSLCLQSKTRLTALRQ